MTESDKIAELEAILYAASRPMGLTDIVSRLRLENEVEADKLVTELQDHYLEDDSALEIVKLPQDRVVLQLKPEFTKQAGRYSLKPLLNEGALRTLSYVAYHQPVEQTDIASARGSQAYKHLNQLDEMGLIKRERSGRTYIVRTTQDFADYLGLSTERTQMRRQLRSIFRKLEVDEMEKK
ncbi:SMC-Scp complex subunit ScpB [archaeon]|nr:SMC-Scp complex subunit ScpB [archaeon]